MVVRTVDCHTVLRVHCTAGHEWKQTTAFTVTTVVAGIQFYNPLKTKITLI